MIIQMMDWNDMMSSSGWTWFTPMIMMGGMLIFLFLSIIFTYIIHQDAIKRGIPNAEIWVLIGLIFNIVGVIVYFICRGNYPERK